MNNPELKTKWHQVLGADLEDAFDRGEGLEELIPACQAIYVWRRSFRPPTGVTRSPAQFAEWIERNNSIPFALIQDKELTHFARLTELVLGGGGLTPDKTETLGEFLRTEKRRRWMARFMRSLREFAPPLYVGETHDLQRRARDHLKGETNLGNALSEGLGLTWADLELLYWNLGSRKTTDQDSASLKSQRTLFEMITTRSTVAGFVIRSG